MWSMCSTPAALRNLENRVIATIGRAPPASRPSPLDRRSRIQRFRQLPQPGLAYRAELQGATAGEAQVVHPPDITWVFGFPAAVLDQVGDSAARIEQQSPRPGVVEDSHRQRRPAVLVVVEQRHHPGPGQEPDRAGNDLRGESAVAAVPALLQRVLHLQPQLPGQVTEPDQLGRGDEPVTFECGCERLRVRASVDLPSRVVGVAELR
jgi:hypothetical protein